MDTLFFFVVKLVSALIRADTWIVLVLGLIVLALVLERRHLAVRLSAAAFAFLLNLSLLPLGDLLLQPLEGRYPVNPALSRADWIIRLVGGEAARISDFWGQPQLNEAGDRYTAALALAGKGSVGAEMVGAFPRSRHCAGAAAAGGLIMQYGGKPAPQPGRGHAGTRQRLAACHQRLPHAPCHA